MNDKFWNALDKVVDDTVRAKQQVEIGAEASMVLNNRHVDGWFKEKIHEIAKIMLSPETRDADLPYWKARSAALLDHYTSLVAKVAAGDRAVARLAELEAQEKATEQVK